MPVTWASALGWRLRRHHLEGRRAPTVEAVVDRLAAVPSWLGDARTAIGLRLAHPGSADLGQALTAGRVVCVYSFRGSMQLMTPGAAAVHLAIRAAGRQWERRSWRTYYELEPSDWPRLRAVVRDAVRAGPLTQDELAAAVATDPAYRHLRAAFEDASQTLLKPLCWQGDLCLDPSAGPVRFRLLADVPGWAGVRELDEAGPEAVRSYLAAYGPATRDRIHHWLTDGLSAGRRRLESWIDGLGTDLVTLAVEGDETLCLAEHADEVRGATPTEAVSLIPGHDPWVLGPGTSDTRVVPAGHRQAVTRGANLVLVGGRAAGTWKAAGADLEIGWFDGGSPAAGTALTAATDRLSSVLGGQPVTAIE